MAPSADIVRPGGSAPDETTNWLYGAVPPLAVSGWLYETLALVAGSVAGANVMTGALTNSQNSSSATNAPVLGEVSSAETVKVNDPAWVGVPPSTPSDD